MYKIKFAENEGGSTFLAGGLSLHGHPNPSSITEHKEILTASTNLQKLLKEEQVRVQSVALSYHSLPFSELIRK